MAATGTGLATSAASGERNPNNDHSSFGSGSSIRDAVSAISTLAGAGAHLSFLLFEVSGQVGSAGDEVRDLGIDISLFCAVLKQLQSVLLRDASNATSTADHRLKNAGVSGAGAGAGAGAVGSDGGHGRVHSHRRASLTAVNTTLEILTRCKDIFGKIDAVVRGLHVDTSKGAALDISARIKWTLRRNKVRTYRATLDSCKITLTLMVNTLTYADVVFARRSSDEKTEIEDAEEEAIARSLASAQLQANARLAHLEKEDEQEDTLDTTSRRDSDSNQNLGKTDSNPLFDPTVHPAHFPHFPPPPAYEPAIVPGRTQASGLESIDPVTLQKGNPYRALRMMPRRSPRKGPTDSGPGASSDRQQPASSNRPPERASVWLNRLLQDEMATLAVDGSRRTSAVSTDSGPRHYQIEQLLSRWTDQGEHWASLHEHDVQLHLRQSLPMPLALDTSANTLARSMAGAGASNIASAPAPAPAPSATTPLTDLIPGSAPGSYGTLTAAATAVMTPGEHAQASEYARARMLGRHLQEPSFAEASIRRQFTAPISPGSKPLQEPPNGFFESVKPGLEPLDD